MHTLILKCASHTLHNCIPHLRTPMHNMKILSPGLTHNPRVTPIHIQIRCNVLPQLPKYKRAPCEVQACKGAVRDGLCDDLGWGSWDELDDAWGHTSFGEYLVDKVVGVGCGG